MEKDKIDYDKGKETIEEIEDTIKNLKRFTDSSIVHLNLTDLINQLNSEKRRIQDEMEEQSSVFYEDSAQSAFVEFIDKNRLEKDEGKDELENDIGKFIDLYKIHVPSNKEDNLPDKEKLKDQLYSFLEEME